MKIIVDKREIRNTKIYKFLLDLGFDVEAKQLRVGDFILGDFIIERKTSNDFIKSIIDRRLFNQIKKMKEYEFSKIFLIVENFQDIFNYNFNDDAIRGALLSILLNDVSIIYSSGPYDTARFLYLLSKKLNKNHKSIHLRPTKPKDIVGLRSYFLQGLPLVGPRLASEILKKFKTPKNFILAKEEDILKIKGLGKLRLKLIKKVLEDSNDK